MFTKLLLLAYITTFCICKYRISIMIHFYHALTRCSALLMLYSPKFAKEAFWSQILSIYSLLLTCGISVSRGDLTHFHAAIAVVLSGSPLTAYLFVYAIVSFWYRKHRLNGIVGEGQLFIRLLIILAGLIWISLFVYILADKRLTHFAQASCIKAGNDVVGGLYIIPFLLLYLISRASHEVPAFSGLVLSIVFGVIGVTVISWISAIILQRKTIWREGERWSPRFGRTW